MRVAVVGARGFVGRHVVAALLAAGDEVIAIGRPGGSGRQPATGSSGRSMVVEVGLTDAPGLARAFDGCDAVVHAAGINRERGADTYERVHVEGTRAVVDAAVAAGVRRIALVSFLRARADGPTAYHRSKWQAETIVRAADLDWTVLRCGVIYGPGDHLVDHVSRATRTFPVFGLVGREPRPVAPVAVDDVVRLLVAAAHGDERLARRTIAVIGPESLALEAAVRRIASVAGGSPWFVPIPVRLHRWLAVGWEATMRVPLAARAQVAILEEGVVESMPPSEPPPSDLRPRRPFDADAIRAALPEDPRFGCADVRVPAWCRDRRGA